MKDIAAKCGVSAATVSKALNGYSDISEETIKLIRKTARDMNYFPNSAARTLKTKRSNNLGILYSENMRIGLIHEYFSSLLEGIKYEAERLGYDITFISRNFGDITSFLNHCLFRQCDGVIIVNADYHDPQVRELAVSAIPVVTIDYSFDGVTSVMSDNTLGVGDLVRYIHSRGHSRIAYIHGDNTLVTQKRLAGFYKACDDLGITIPKEYVKPAMFHDLKSTCSATNELLKLKNRPTCIMYPDDFCCIGGIYELIDAKLDVPRDISVTGYDGIMISQVLKPRLTTLQQDAPSLGGTAAKLLINKIENPKSAFTESVVIPGNLIKGETVMDLTEQQQYKD